MTHWLLLFSTMLIVGRVFAAETSTLRKVRLQDLVANIKTYQDRDIVSERIHVEGDLSCLEWKLWFAQRLGRAETSAGYQQKMAIKEERLGVIREEIDIRLQLVKAEIRRLKREKRKLAKKQDESEFPPCSIL